MTSLPEMELAELARWLDDEAFNADSRALNFKGDTPQRKEWQIRAKRFRAAALAARSTAPEAGKAVDWREAMQLAIDYLKETKHGSPARSAGHNARLVLEAALSTEPGEAEETCPVCAKPFKPNDLCSTDIELGTCHAACLQGCPTVDLNTGEPISGPIPTYRYDEDSASPEGWLLVPRDPTEFMIDNAEEAMQERRNFGLKIYAIDVWNAMLVAAPLHEDTHHG